MSRATLGLLGSGRAWILIPVCGAWLANPVQARLWRVPVDVSTVGAALSQAVSGDSVSISPGTWSCSATVRAGVRMVGNGPLGSVVLDAGGAGAVLTVLDADRTTLIQDLVLQGGVGALADGTREGGGVYSARSSMVLRRVRISGCQAEVGGGIYFDQGSPSLTNCTLDRNAAAFGGGMALNRATAQLDSCSIRENRASDYGGGVLVVNGAALAMLRGELRINQASGDGGGLYVLTGSANLQEVELVQNSAARDGGGAYCGSGSSLLFTGDVFSRNASSRGGGLFAGCGQPALKPGAGTSLGQAASSFCSDVQLFNCTLGYNSASVAGSAVACTDAGRLRMLNSIVAYGTGSSAVACLDLRTTLDIRCNDTYRNTPADWSGCGDPAQTGLANQTLNPLFCDGSSGVYYLCENSPLAAFTGCVVQQIGAREVGCGHCDTPVRPTTWGQLRRIFGGASSR